MPDSMDILTLAVDAGDALLRSGGEIYRAEETVSRILDAFEIQNRDVYVLSNGIFASVNTGEKDACSIIRQVPLREMHLGRIAAVNQLSREICEKKHTVCSAREALSSCRAIPAYPPLIQEAACGLGCACFCLLFGGKACDALLVLALGALLQMFRLSQQKKNTSKFITNMIGSAFLTAASLLTSYIPVSVRQDLVVIGGIMPLVPGIAFTTSIRDLFNGDFLSGAIHLLDALLTAMSIAVGVGFVITMYLSAR